MGHGYGNLTNQFKQPTTQQEAFPCVTAEDQRNGLGIQERREMSEYSKARARADQRQYVADEREAELTRLRSIESLARAVTTSHQALDTPAFLKALEGLRVALATDSPPPCIDSKSQQLG